MTALSISYPISTVIFNKSIESGVFPTSWKSSLVVPIPKANCYSSPSNKLQTSISSTNSEQITRVAYQILWCPPLPSTASFQLSMGTDSKPASQLTEAALLETTHNLLQLMEEGRKLVLYSSILRRRLILSLIVPCFKARDPWYQQTLAQMELSKLIVSNKWLLMVQHPHLQMYYLVFHKRLGGPLLFLMYINDVCSVELSSNGHITLYADDILIYKPIQDVQDYTAFHTDVDTISHWVENNHLHFNVQKCKSMLVSRKRAQLPPPILKLYGQQLQMVDTYKCLGLIISSYLSWSKAKRLLGILYRRFSAHSNSNLLFKLYLSLVRSHLEYASAVWSPYKAGEVQAIEDVQKYSL